MTVLINDEPDRLDLAASLAEVSRQRREYALRYRFEIDRKLSVAVYMLLKRALKSEYGIDGNPKLAIGPNGKPYLAEHPEIHFNFSHCAKAAACIVGDSPVGVDVETIAPVDDEVAKRVLSETELARVRESNEPEVEFAILWTRKEALVKMRGTGIDDAELPHLLDGVSDGAFETRVCRGKGYVLSAVVR